MVNAIKVFAKELFFERNNDSKNIIISKTKIGIWLGAIFYILFIKGFMDLETVKTSCIIAAAILGAGVRDFTLLRK